MEPRAAAAGATGPTLLATHSDNGQGNRCRLTAQDMEASGWIVVSFIRSASAVLGGKCNKSLVSTSITPTGPFASIVRPYWALCLMTLPMLQLG